MNKMLIPIITFKGISPDESRIETAYARIFEIAKRNILVKRLLTSGLSKKYTGVQSGKKVFNN